MGVQQSIELRLDERDLFFEHCLVAGNRLVRLGLRLGPLGQHFSIDLCRQSDSGNGLTDLLGKHFFSDITFSALSAFLGAAIIVVTLLSLCRYGATAGCAGGKAKERKLLFPVFVGPPVSVEGLLDTVEELLRKQRLVDTLMQLAREPHETVVKRVLQHPVDFGLNKGFPVAAHQAQSEGFFPHVFERAAARRVDFKQLPYERASDRIDDDFSEILVVDVTKRRAARPLASSEFLADASLHVLREIVDVILGLPKGDIEHELALRGVFKPERGELEVTDMAGVQEIHDPAAINGIAGEAVRMPCDYSARLALLYS